MQLKDVFCYAVLTITVAATCVQAEENVNDIEEKQLERRMSRRTATIIVDGAPVERMFQKPKVIYRRISKKRYSPRTTHGPSRPKYGPPRSARKPAKKYRGKAPSKRTPSNLKKRAPKPRYGPPPKRPTMKPVYGPPKIASPYRSQHQQENTGFGEPPSSFTKHRPIKDHDYYTTNFESDSSKPDFGNDYSSKPDFDVDFPSKSTHSTGPEFSSPASFLNDFSQGPFGEHIQPKPQFSDYPNSKLNYAEPPVDSYGAPIKPNLRDLTFPSAQSSLGSTLNFDIDNTAPDSVQWGNFREQTPDNNFAYSKKQPSFSKPDSEVYVTPVPQEHNEEQYLNSYSDIFNYRATKNNKKKKKVNYNMENIIMVNKPWKGNKMKADSNEEIIVGGQYAEPPARYVPKFQPSAPMHNHDDSVFSPPLSFSDPETASSATMSSYVNYKNSNMAFSPQNLNDAFSIVDKR